MSSKIKCKQIKIYYLLCAKHRASCFTCIYVEIWQAQIVIRILKINILGFKDITKSVESFSLEVIMKLGEGKLK